jgi:DNA repair protein RecO (recombination protein O)
MQWADAAIVVAVRRHGESGLVAALLTREHGRHLGFVRGGQSPKRRAVLQPGNEVAATWRARLPEHLGTFGVELVRAHAASFLDDPDRLAALVSAMALVAMALPEREPYGDVFAAVRHLVADLDSASDWPARYVRWECELLATLGFGLDFGRCAVTGTTLDLAYVSPRTGRAVCRAAGAPYHDKLLPLPLFLRYAGPAAAADIEAGLRLTGHFLHYHLLAPQSLALPPARTRFELRMHARGTADIISRSTV